MNLNFSLSSDDLADTAGLDAGAVDAHMRANHDAIVEAATSAVVSVLRAADLPPKAVEPIAEPETP